MSFDYIRALTGSCILWLASSFVLRDEKIQIALGLMRDSSFSVGFRNCDLMLPAGVMFSRAEIQHVPQAWIRLVLPSWSTRGTDYLQLDSNLLFSPEMQRFY
jgi:hypothetical protein